MYKTEGPSLRTSHIEDILCFPWIINISVHRKPIEPIPMFFRHRGGCDFASNNSLFFPIQDVLYGQRLAFIDTVAVGT